MALVLAGGNPLRRIPVAYVNKALILACVLSFVLGLPPEPFAFVPAYVFGTVEVAAPLPLGDTLRGVFGHVLVHGDPVHLVTNMVALWVFGDNVEDALGHVRYLAFFLLCAAVGALSEGVMAVEPMRPLVGASGAISGVMGAYLLLHPHAKLLILLFFRIPVLLPASLVVGGDLAANVAMAVFQPAGAGMGDVAWWAHIGGFAAGMLLVVPLRRAGVPLFHPADAYPEVPFPRLQTVLVDFFPARRRPGNGVMAAGKAAVYLGLVAVLIWTL